MSENDPVNLTRRTMVAACASAGAVGIAETASAQRLPAPPRAKGPLVWLDMDQQELDDAYDQRVYAPNQPNITERRNWNSEKVRAVWASRCGCRTARPRSRRSRSTRPTVRTRR
jgi:hypothetical protein